MILTGEEAAYAPVVQRIHETNHFTKKTALGSARMRGLLTEGDSLPLECVEVAPECCLILLGGPTTGLTGSTGFIGKRTGSPISHEDREVGSVDLPGFIHVDVPILASPGPQQGSPTTAAVSCQFRVDVRRA